MPTVVVMLTGLGLQELARKQIDPATTVRFCATGESLVELATAGAVDAVISDVRDSGGASVMPAFAVIRRRAPHLPLILHCLPTPEALRDIPSIIAVTTGLTVVFRHCEDLGLALHSVLRASRVPGAGETLARHVVPLVPGPFRSFLLVSALKASPGLKVKTAAGWSGLQRRTLERALLTGTAAQRERTARLVHRAACGVVARRSGVVGQAGGDGDGIPPQECHRPGVATVLRLYHGITPRHRRLPGTPPAVRVQLGRSSAFPPAETRILNLSQQSNS